MKYLFLTLLLTMLLSCGGGSNSSSKNNIKYSSGSSGCSSGQLFGCVEASDFIDAQGKTTATSQTIANCTIIERESQVCNLSTLNFIANNSSIVFDDEKPSKQDILDKLIVSDQWMADNFSTLLEDMPDDIYYLLTSVTAIVIHENIRPAFFLSATGAIYLDPQYLWISQQDKEQVPTTEDYRSSYSSGLAYNTYYRYSLNGVYAFENENGTRNENQARFALSALLFHELAHARDFFPLSEIAEANTDLRPTDLTNNIGFTSSTLVASHALQSQELFDIADVKFKGKNASNFIKSLTATQVGHFFEADGATDEYNYASHAEDVAMLFEEVMLKQHYDIDRELAFVTSNTATPENCDDYDWDYTVINRFSDDNVLPRVSLVVNSLLPVNTSNSILASPPTTGTFTWCQESVAAAYRSATNTTILTLNNQEKMPVMDYWH